MGLIKNQYLLHATKDGRRTLCGLSNQFKDAYEVEAFKEKASNPVWADVCCKKCQK